MDEDSSKHLKKITDLLQSPEATELIVNYQKSLTAAKALPPEHGGDGEQIKALWVKEKLQALPVDTLTEFPVPDPRVSSGFRPNLIATIKGEINETLWIFGHLDVVSPGDLSAWQQDPFEVKQDGDWLIGRGVEDNQQGLVSMLILAWALRTAQITPKRSLGLVFMADEENGSHYGLSHLLTQKDLNFLPSDLYVVPDFGSSDARNIEIAEKAQMWLKIEVQGQQCHASTPEKGKNAFVAGAEIVTQLHTRLPEIYPLSNDLFTPKISTFVPTLHEANGEAINVVPAIDIFYMDCRLVPEVELGAVLTSVRRIVAAKAHALGVKAKVSLIQKQEASQVDPKHPHLEKLTEAIAQVYNVKAQPVGVGGATVAYFLRQRGLPALVWSCLENTCHQPNERSSITATGKDSCVFAHLLLK